MDQNLISDNNHTLSSANASIVPAVNGKTQSCASNGHNNSNGATTKKKIRTHETPPPDGGTRAWCVVISAFLCNGIIFGIINTYGTIYLSLQEDLKSKGDNEASSKAALVGSLTIGTTFFLSPVSGILTDKIGLRKTTLIGGIFTASGMFISAAFWSNLTVLYISFGVMFGTGAALAYTPTLAILGHYFQNYLGIVSGFVTSSSSIFTVILPKILQLLLTNYGLSMTCCILGCMSCIVILCALIYKPLQVPPPPPARKPGQTRANMFFRSLVNTDNWRKKRYVIWALAIPLALVGYFVPYVHLAKYVKGKFPDSDEHLPIMCIGMTSGIGRIAFGLIADLKGVNRILLQQIAFLVIGVLTIAIPLTDTYYVLVAIALGIGIVDGCFIALLGPIAYDICGKHGATQAIGFLLGLCSIPLTAGPPIAGMLYDHTQSYKWSFILAGIPAILGALAMSFAHICKQEIYTIETDQAHLPLAKPAWNEEKGADAKVSNGTTYPFSTLSNVDEFKTNGDKQTDISSNAVGEKKF